MNLAGTHHDSKQLYARDIYR